MLYLEHVKAKQITVKLLKIKGHTHHHEFEKERYNTDVNDYTAILSFKRINFCTILLNQIKTTTVKGVPDHQDEKKKKQNIFLS